MAAILPFILISICAVVLVPLEHAIVEALLWTGVNNFEI